MRIIGVDPGLTHTGIGVIEKLGQVANPGSGLRLVLTEVINPPRTDLSKKLLFIYDHLLTTIEAHGAEIMAVEDQFFGKNIQTAFKTGQARGAALLAAAKSGIPVSLFPPARVKQAVVGNGRASKEQVQHMVAQILKLDRVPVSLDCTDALAVALCQSFKSELL